MLEKELEDYFQQTAQKVEVDCANSYKKLGGQRRDWYLLLSEAAGAVCKKDMEIIYRVKLPG